MNHFIEYLPRNKHDFERVYQLKAMERTELLPLLPHLMEWIQDMNWPIAEEVAELLLTFPDEIAPLIKNVFTTDDDIWKYWCLLILVKRLPEELRKLVKDDLIRLREKPTVGEQYEELDEIASELLQTMN